jgi:general secretion pathway protein F
MPNFRYQALTEKGDLVSGVIEAPTAADVAHRIGNLRLVPIEESIEEARERFNFRRVQRIRPEAITIFTLDLALLLKAGSRLDDALELLSTDHDLGNLQRVVAAVRSSILAGESLADALTHHPSLFPPVYIALIRVGETSGMLDHMLQVLAGERGRAEALRRKLSDSLRYPTVVFFGAISVLIFFLLVVLPRFSAVLHDFGAQIDPVAGFFFDLSDFMVAHQPSIGLLVAIALIGCLLVFRKPQLRTQTFLTFMRLPLVRVVFAFHRTALLCRNLQVLLTAAVPLTTALRILVGMMETMSVSGIWVRVVERVRHGGKLSEALGETGVLPAMALRMIRLGEESGQLPVLIGRVAEFYEIKLQRSLDRLVEFIGPAAIVVISIVVGGLIISVMTSLLSVNQLVG